MSNLLQAEQLSRHLATHTLFRGADDAEETCARVGQVFRPHHMGVLGTSQRLAAQMDHLPLARLSFNRLSYGASVSINSEPMNDFVMVFMPLAGEVAIRSGEQRVASSPRQAAVVSSTQALHMEWRADADVFILRLERQAIEDACLEQVGHLPSRPIEFDLAVDSQAPHVGSWQALLSFLLGCGDFTRLAAGQPLVAAQVERQVASTLLFGHRHSYSGALTGHHADVAPAFVRRAEDAMAAHLHTPMRIESLAGLAGVSVRSLHEGFRRYRDTTPMAAWKALRLDQVRAELLAAARHGEPTTVAEVAQAHGFLHLGHFAQSYQSRFNERPSETLNPRPR
jgi:AraC-like DNA-binding protein